MAQTKALSQLIGQIPGRLWLITRIGLLLLTGAIGALLWLSYSADVDERRATLISDMLWLEQDLRFHLVHNEELLGRLGAERLVDHAHTVAQGQSLLTGGGLRQILWLDKQGKTVFAVPDASTANLVGETGGAVPSGEVTRMAKALGRASYTAAYPVLAGDWQFEVHVPAYAGGRPVGTVVGIYSLQRLIDDAVPWWLTERYRVAVIDSGEKELISRSKVAPLSSNNSYQLSFDPPGHGLALQAIPYAPPPAPVRWVLSGALVVLAISVIWSLTVLRRLTLRRQAAEAALLAEHAFRMAMENSLQTGLRARDLKGKVVYVNAAFCRMVGWSAEELIGCSPPMPYWTDDESETTQRIHDRILAGEGPDAGFEQRLKRRNGEVFTALIHEAPLIDASGKQTGWMGSVIDISERKLADERTRLQQERLQATARLVAVGEMASSLAHELNQPLAAISSYCTAGMNLLQAGNQAKDVQPVLEKAVEQAQRAGQIIRRIYGVVRRSEGRTEALRLDECVDAALSLLAHELRRHGVFTRIAYTARPVVLGDKVLLEQALFNLLRNAIDAVQDRDDALREIAIDLSLEADYAHLAIADRGHGVPVELASQVFDPLFTTKTEGMGMGLAICRSVIETHRGRLWFDANPGGGTIFHIMLPVAPQ